MLAKSLSRGAIQCRNLLLIGCFLFLPGVLFSTVAQKTAEEVPRDASEKRALDRHIVSNLMQNSSLVIVGEIVSQSPADRYRMALNPNTPFKVQISRVLVGHIPKDKPITVAVARDEVEFRYPMGQPFIFFLKKTPPSADKTSDPILRPGEWRAVADYFGIWPHTLTLERMVKTASEEMKSEARQD